MTDDTDVLTWADVKARMDGLERGKPYQLAQALGMNSSYFYRKLKGRDPLTAQQAVIIRGFLNNSPVTLPGPPEPRRVPVYGYPAGDDELFAMSESQVMEWLQLPLGVELGPGDWFAVRKIGSSMAPRIFAGEYLVCRRNFPPAHNKDVVIELTDGTGLVKTYRSQRQGQVFVEQYDPPAQTGIEATRVKALHAVAFKL